MLSWVPQVALAAWAIGFGLLGMLSARRARRPFVPWLVFGMILGPFAALLVRKAPPSRCPTCQAKTVGWSTTCPECGRDTRRSVAMPQPDRAHGGSYVAGNGALAGNRVGGSDGAATAPAPDATADNAPDTIAPTAPGAMPPVFPSIASPLTARERRTGQASVRPAASGSAPYSTSTLFNGRSAAGSSTPAGPSSREADPLAALAAAEAAAQAARRAPHAEPDARARAEAEAAEARAAAEVRAAVARAEAEAREAAAEAEADGQALASAQARARAQAAAEARRRAAAEARANAEAEARARAEDEARAEAEEREAAEAEARIHAEAEAREAAAAEARAADERAAAEQRAAADAEDAAARAAADAAAREEEEAREAEEAASHAAFAARVAALGDAPADDAADVSSALGAPVPDAPAAPVSAIARLRAASGASSGTSNGRTRTRGAAIPVGAEGDPGRGAVDAVEVAPEPPAASWAGLPADVPASADSAPTARRSRARRAAATASAPEESVAETAVIEPVAPVAPVEPVEPVAPVAGTAPDEPLLAETSADGPAPASGRRRSRKAVGESEPVAAAAAQPPAEELTPVSPPTAAPTAAPTRSRSRARVAAAAPAVPPPMPAPLPNAAMPLAAAAIVAVHGVRPLLDGSAVAAPAPISLRAASNAPIGTSHREILATGVYVGGTERLTSGEHYSIAINGDVLEILGPMTSTPTEVVTSRRVGAAEIVGISDRLVITGLGREKRTFILVLDGLVGMTAEAIERRFVGQAAQGGAA